MFSNNSFQHFKFLTILIQYQISTFQFYQMARKTFIRIVDACRLEWSLWDFIFLEEYFQHFRSFVCLSAYHAFFIFICLCYQDWDSIHLL